MTNNPLHGYESFKIPNQFQILWNVPPTYYRGKVTTPRRLGGMPITPALHQWDSEYGFQRIERELS